MKLTLLILSIFLSFQANAGFYLDPYAGVKILGNAKLAGREFSHQQLEFGSKIGWHGGNTQFGLDLNLLYPTYKSKGVDPVEESYSGFQYGIFLGGRYGWFRGWGTWVIAASQTSDIDSSTIKGTGWEFGVACGPKNFINAFLKLQLLQFRKRKTTSGTEVDLSNGQEIETRAIVFGFDIPFAASGRGK